MKKGLIFLMVLVLLISLVLADTFLSDSLITTTTIDGQINCSNFTGVNGVCGKIDDAAHLGEIRMVATSLSGAENISQMRSYGWAVADGTTPSAQGISGANITSTPNLVDKFIRGDASTSGTTGGSETHEHGYIGSAADNDYAKVTYRTYYIGSANHLPPYYEMVYMIKVKE